jgi:hypothetical protein
MSWRAALRRAAVATDRLMKERRFSLVDIVGITKSPENVLDKVSKNKKRHWNFQEWLASRPLRKLRRRCRSARF